MSEYRIRINYPAPAPPSYPLPSFESRAEAEAHLEIVKEQNTESNIFFTVVYGVFYEETGGFAEGKEPEE